MTIEITQSAPPLRTCDIAKIIREIIACTQKNKYADALAICKKIADAPSLEGRLENIPKDISQEIHKDIYNDQTPENIVKAYSAWCHYHLAPSAETLALMLDATPLLSHDSIMSVKVQYLLLKLHRYDELVESCYLSRRLFPDDKETNYRLAIGHFFLGEYRIASDLFKGLLKTLPTPIVAYSLGLSLLHLGKYQEGFTWHENRLDAHKDTYWVNDTSFPMPRWKGEGVNGKSLLLWCEQGLGDTIQFIRFATMLANQGAIVDLWLNNDQQSLCTLLKTVEGIRTIFTAEQQFTDPYDYHCPLMSLPYGFDVRLESIPNRVPYIAVDSHHHTHHHKPWNDLRCDSTSNPPLKIAIVWSTHFAKTKKDGLDNHNYVKEKKNIPIELFKPLLLSQSQVLNNIQFFSLKLSPSTSEKQHLAECNVTDITDRITTFSDTSAAIHHMDIVISIDTSVVHLAGAMGKPTINLLPFHSDWRWQTNRDDSPWYPSMRLYRQEYEDDWTTVIERVKNTLQRTAAHYQKTGMVMIDG